MKALTEESVAVLLGWYAANKRTLPWREEVSPYRTWVSEIMLQQTRVEAAKGYFLRWMERFSTLSDLAAATEEEVLKAWEGLGYYSRARNLHKAAKLITERFGGKLPSDRDALVKIPGIGVYTAGAILSIAFGKPEPAVDSNVLRVVSRLEADPFDVTKNEVRVAIADALRPLMPEGKTSDFTQALFELGALICIPNATPHCADCPMRPFCEGYAGGNPQDFPVKVQKAEKRREQMTVFVLSFEGKYAIRKRPASGLLAGLFELPNEKGFLSAEEVAARYAGEITPLPAAEHVFTHIVWDMRGFYVRLSAPPEDADRLFVSPEELAETYPLPAAFSTYKKYCR